MTKRYLEADEFESLKSRITAGEASMRVSKSVSRQFFLRVTNESVKAETGESVSLQRIVIWVGALFPVFLLFAALWQIIVDFGWAATIAVPLVGVFWTVVAGFTADKGGWIESTIGLVLGIGIAAITASNYGVPLALITISLVVHRLSYALAQHWVERLVSQSFAAYDMLVEHIVINDPTGGAASEVASPGDRQAP